MIVVRGGLLAGSRRARRQPLKSTSSGINQLRLRVPLLLRLLRELLEVLLLRELDELLPEVLLRDLLELDLLERVLPRLLPRFVRRAGGEPPDS